MLEPASRVMLLLGAMTCFSIGCAGYRITPHGTGSGYDIYRPMPYILLTSTETVEKDDKRTVKYDGGLVWLPDYSARYRVKTWNFFGKADFAFTFAEGWRLESLTDKSDNTDVATTLITAAKELASKAIVPVAAADGDKSKQEAPPPFLLYRVAYDKNGYVAGLEKMKEPATHSPPTFAEKGFEWPGLLGGLGWLLGFGTDSFTDPLPKSAPTSK